MEDPLTDRYPYRIGRIIRAHALRGDVVVQRFRALRLKPRDLKGRSVGHDAHVWLERDDDSLGWVRRLTRVRWLDPSRVVVHFDGVDDRDAAERLQGAFVDIDPHAPPDGLTDEVDKIFGASALNAETGEAIGTVEDVRDNGAQPILQIGEEPGVLIPWVEAFIERVDDGPPRRVHIRPIPGLLEVNDV
ncbi:MAG: hypothetical protein AAF449_02690 [Myxococcota bacterium]